ncbi:nectin-3-like protein isoform X2 [Anguilla rostrata]|uniref:nectin-3-like protein isoform X2 n=1 Tax=Anguilla rostrata TaxID=7938 RepID=UPI0030CA63B7
MAVRMSFHCHGSTSFPTRMKATFLLLFFSVSGAGSNQVVVSEKVGAVLGKNITLGCRIEVGANLSLTQSSWERRLPSGTLTLAVFNPQFGISVAPEYEKRLHFRSPSAHDATVVLEDVGFADSGVYTCKVATFPLGNTQAFTTVSVMVEPKVYVSAGSAPLLDGGNETAVATCTAERGRPRAEVSWESELLGRSVAQDQDEPNGTTTTLARYMWRPTRRAQGHALTCVVRHPALQTEFRIPYRLNVQFAPDVVLTGYDGSWFAGRETARLQCRAHANPPAHYVSWSRVGGEIPDGVEVANGTLVFARPLQRNDSGEYRCEAWNDLGRRSREIQVQIQDEPQTSPTSSAAVAGAVIGAVLALFLITVFIIVLLTPRSSRPPTYMDKVIDLPPTHKPPPAYTERPGAIPLAVSTPQVYYPAQVYYPSQVRREGRPHHILADAYPGPERGREMTSGRTHELLSYQEWICHLNGADRVHVHHREHYV